MDRWKSTSLSLGSLRAGEKKRFSFESARALENIKDISASCSSCTSILGYDPEKGELILEFSTSKFPVHLSLEGKNHYDSNKHVTVEYQDGSMDKLYFSARVYK